MIPSTRDGQAPLNNKYEAKKPTKMMTNSFILKSDLSSYFALVTNIEPK